MASFGLLINHNLDFVSKTKPICESFKLRYRELNFRGLRFLVIFCSRNIQ